MGYLKAGRIYKLTKDNLSKVPNTGGIYKIYNSNKCHDYTGTTKGNVGAKWGSEEHQRYRYGLRHRLGSYIQKDDYEEHPTKKSLRATKNRYFAYYPVRNDDRRRELEKKMKQGVRHNHL
jgi:hypothetical protein